MSTLKAKGSILGATLLVAGTCIGGGMLALPVATGVAGFIPSVAMMLLGWAFMTLTAFFLVEVNLWMEGEVHIVTMASRLLGPVGKALAWVLYLFISYASLVAYTAGGGELIVAFFKLLLGVELSPTLAAILFTLLFGVVIYLGNIILGRINTLLVFGMLIAYVLLVGLGMMRIDISLLARQSWNRSLMAVPLLLTIFSFQTIVPSLTIYLKRDGRSLRIAILSGTLLALVVYLLWEALVLGVVPLEGEFGLARALLEGRPATEFLRVAIEQPLISSLAEFFAFFALGTSFLGMALGLYDFLADGLKIKKRGHGPLTLGLLVAVPTLFFVLTLEKVFLLALDCSGGIGDALLNGILPILMLWVGRYRKRFHSEYRVPGGKPLLVVAGLYALFVFILEVTGHLGCGISLFNQS